MNNTWILAQSAAEQDAPSQVTSTPVNGETETGTIEPASPEQPAQQQGQKTSPMSSFLLLGLMFVAMYFILFRGPRKQQQERKKMVQSLQKNDRVQTIGGIIGTVIDVKDDEITIKIDEANNTKIKVIPSAIGKNMSQDKK